jgi:hypothetical protein
MPKNDAGCRFCRRSIDCEDCERLQRENGKEMFFYVVDVILGPRASATAIQDRLDLAKRMRLNPNSIPT